MKTLADMLRETEDPNGFVSKMEVKEEEDEHVIHAGEEIFRILVKVTHQMDIDISVKEVE